jgi:tape measure domain-containing protein
MEIFRQCLEDDLTSAEAIARKMGVSKGTVSKLAKRGLV